MRTLRLALLGALIALVGVSGYLLRHRQRYGKLLENTAVNLALVVVYNLLCYLLVGLPSDRSVVPPPAFLSRSTVRVGFSVVGQVLIGLAALTMIVSVWQRKALGGQEVKQGLLTAGIYRVFRHPIYAGIIGMSLGLALASVNWDGLLMVPAVVLANAAQAAIEERYDVGVRFRSQYEEYRKRTGMFGPLWAWAVLVGALVALVGALVALVGASYLL
jgi:protein-S-isoprenylcysteine O-methyltransferase Ste14